jgi:hypothetical protein
MFQHYPQVLVVDTMHKANKSHNLLNVVSVDGNLLNNPLLRAYIPCGTSAIYRWVLGVAMPSMVPTASLLQTEVVMSDSESALTNVIDSLTCVGDILCNAVSMRCCWHMLDKNLADRFGVYGPDSWQARAIKNLYRIQKCDTLDELKKAVAFLMQSLAAEPELPLRSSTRREVMEFMLARISKASKWVRFYFLMRCTHGIKASQRVEVDFSALTRIGIGARLTWETSARRMMLVQDRRHRERMQWITHQLTGELFRDVTNKADSTLSKQDLLHLEKLVLPWALDAFEEQLLLAAVRNLRAQYIGCHSVKDQSAFTFCVDYGDSGLDVDENPDVMAAARASYQPSKKQDEDTSSDSDTEQPTPSLSANDLADAQAESCEEAFLQGLQDGVDAQSVRRQGVLFDDSINYDDPVPVGTVFAYKKIRHVMFKQCADAADKCYASCTCGFMKQHGVCCRHVLAVLLIIMRAKRTGQDAIWNGFDLQQCFNMNLVSKHKYHAACFSSDKFLAATTDVFRMDFATIANYCSTAVVTPDSELPCAGVPTAPMQHNAAAVMGKLFQNDTNENEAPVSPRKSERPRAWNTQAASLMYQTIMRHFISDENKEQICQTFQSLIASLERKAPHPGTLVDDARLHTPYDKMHGRKREGRGGLAKSPPPKLQKATDQPALEAQLPVVFKGASSPLRMSCMQQLTSPTRNTGAGLTSPTSPTTMSQGCHHFRTGMTNLNEIGNYVVASQELQAAVDLGHLEAHARLALMYILGYPHMPKNHTAAFKLAETGANFKNNCPHCLGVLSLCYYYGMGVRKNGATAMKHAKSSSAKDSYVGHFVLARMFFAGDVVSENATSSFEFFSKSAAQNFADAQFSIGYLYEWGYGVQKCAQQALNYYGLAAQQGCREAQTRLADCFQEGVLVERKNIMEAVRLYTASAEQGCSDACSKLCDLYEKGAVGLRKDLTLAQQWHARGVAASGLPAAALMSKKRK